MKREVEIFEHLTVLLYIGGFFATAASHNGGFNILFQITA
jgi:hypothetical protein